MGDEFLKSLLENDLVQMVGIILAIAVIVGGFKGYMGWEDELDEFEQSTRLTNSDGWSLYDCSSSHLDHNQRFQDW
jgi:hypothetical protein